MTLYHGSSVIIKTPELRHSVCAPDFGRAFYAVANGIKSLIVGARMKQEQ
jgi:hypothetical protein